MHTFPFFPRFLFPAREKGIFSFVVLLKLHTQAMLVCLFWLLIYVHLPSGLKYQVRSTKYIYYRRNDSQGYLRTYVRTHARSSRCPNYHLSISLLSFFRFPSSIFLRMARRFLFCSASPWLRWQEPAGASSARPVTWSTYECRTTSNCQRIRGESK